MNGSTDRQPALFEISIGLAFLVAMCGLRGEMADLVWAGSMAIILERETHIRLPRAVAHRAHGKQPRGDVALDVMPQSRRAVVGSSVSVTRRHR
jgi:hypothetical protein